MKRQPASSFNINSRCWSAAALVCILVELTGCGTSGYPLSGGGAPPTGYVYLTGDWVLQATPTTGPAPFASLSGYIDEQNGNAGVNDLTTASLQVQQPSNCYLDALIIPLQGTLSGTQLGLFSFSVNGQYVSVTATKDATATHLSGTYSISGGCAGGSAGSLAGTKYSALHGTYAGSVAGITPAESLQLSLGEDSQAAGDGSFPVTGTGVFTGFSCFTTATVNTAASSVVGNLVKVTLNTNDVAGAQLVLTGTIDPAASTFQVGSGAITGGSCPGSLGAATLTLQ